MGSYNGGKAEYEGKVTVFVVLACIVAASGGLLFGYDIGITGRYNSCFDDFEQHVQNFFSRTYNLEGSGVSQLASCRDKPTGT